VALALIQQLGDLPGHDIGTVLRQVIRVTVQAVLPLISVAVICIAEQSGRVEHPHAGRP